MTTKETDFDRARKLAFREGINFERYVYECPVFPECWCKGTHKTTHYKAWAIVDGFKVEAVRDRAYKAINKVYSMKMEIKELSR